MQTQPRQRRSVVLGMVGDVVAGGQEGFYPVLASSKTYTLIARKKRFPPTTQNTSNSVRLRVKNKIPVLTRVQGQNNHERGLNF